MLGWVSHLGIYLVVKVMAAQTSAYLQSGSTVCRCIDLLLSTVYFHKFASSVFFTNTCTCKKTDLSAENDRVFFVLAWFVRSSSLDRFCSEMHYINEDKL